MVWNSRYRESPVHADRKLRIGLAGCSVREDQAANVTVGSFSLFSTWNGENLG
jgi:hypothetical protein